MSYSLVEHRCVPDCPVCEWLRDRHLERTPPPVRQPVRQVILSWPAPMRGLTALSLLGANVVTLK